MIRANDKGLATAPDPVVQDTPARPGLVSPRNIIILLGIVAWIAVIFLFVVPNLTRKPAPAAGAATEQAADNHAVAKPGGAAANGAPKAINVPQLVIDGRVFNLAGTTAGFKYVKMSLIVQFEDEKGEYGKAKGDSLTKLQQGFQAENATVLVAFNDILTTTISAKTAAELSTSQGKENLRKELIDKFNAALGGKEHVTYVLFSDFVMQ